MRRPVRRAAGSAGRDERGDFAVFVAVIVVALVFFGSLAWDGPRLIAARQNTAHLANEAARVAIGTIASGGSPEDAHDAAAEVVGAAAELYGLDPYDFDADGPLWVPPYSFGSGDSGLVCVGNRVKVTVESRYHFRSALAVLVPSQKITRRGAAEVLLILPNGENAGLDFLAECPLPPTS